MWLAKLREQFSTYKQWHVLKDKAMILRHLGAIAEVVMFNKLVVFDCQTLVQIIIISIKASVQSSNQHGKDKYMTDNPEGYTKSADKATK